MKLKDILKSVEYISIKADENEDYNDLTADSREVKDGMIFVAIKGYEFDGHQYIDKALENNAKLIVHSEKIPYDQSKNYLLVKDTRKARAEISHALSKNPSKKLNMIGVTGTNGKTTTSTYIYSFLNELGSKSTLIGTEGSYVVKKAVKSDNTTPEIEKINEILDLSLKEDVKNAIIETSSHALLLKRVYKIDFNYAVFTNLSKEHMNFHHDFENYFNAKMILFENASKKVTNIDDFYGKKVKELYPDAITVSMHDKNADFYAENLEIIDGNMYFTINDVKFTLKGVAKYNIYNLLEACAVLSDMGYDLVDISKVVAEFKGIRSRFEYIENDLGLNIVIDFAHTPYAFDKLLESLKGNEIYAVYALNGDRTVDIRNEMGEIAAKHDIFSVVTMEDPKFDTADNIANDIINGIKKLNGRYTYIKNRKEAIRYAVENCPKGGFVLLLGKGDEDFMKINGNNKVPYLERDTLKEVLDEI